MIHQYLNSTPQPFANQSPDLDSANRLLSEGGIDGVVCGAATSSGAVIKSAFKNVGLAENVSSVSSFFLMEIEDARHFRRYDGGEVFNYV
jgi:phosphotransacetylase